jgi:hypothetical protein
MEQRSGDTVRRAGNDGRPPRPAPWSWIVVLAVIGLAAALTGCGDDGDEASVEQGAQTGAGSDRGGGCAVLSEDEVAEAAGIEVTGSTELPTGCQWAVGDAGPGAYYEWQEVPTGGFEANRSPGAGFESEDLSGLGDEAYLRTAVGPGGEVTAGETWVTVGGTELFVRSGAIAWSDQVADAERAIAALLVTELG